MNKKRLRRLRSFFSEKSLLWKELPFMLDWGKFRIKTFHSHSPMIARRTQTGLINFELELGKLGMVIESIWSNRWLCVCCSTAWQTRLIESHGVWRSISNTIRRDSDFIYSFMAHHQHVFTNFATWSDEFFDAQMISRIAIRAISVTRTRDQ